LDGIEGVGAVEEEDVDDGEPGAGSGEGISVFVGDVPCLAETCKSRESDYIGSNVCRHEGCEVFHEGRCDSVCDGFVEDLFFPLGKGSFFGRG